MKLYYDTLIPYMPDSITNESGELVADERKSAGRKAMIELANFQNDGNTLSLYQSVIFACTYADVDLVDTITNIPTDIEISFGATVDSMLDEAATMLFKSIKPTEPFDINKFVADVLTASHTITRVLIQQKGANNSEEISTEVTETPQD